MQSASWLEDTTAGPVAHLLLAHPEPRSAFETVETIAVSMDHLADALTLAEAGPYIRIRPAGRRLYLRRLAAGLTIDGSQGFGYVAGIKAEWREAVIAGTPVCLSVALDPLPAGSNHANVSAFFYESMLLGRVRMGTVNLADWR
ncbi:hypothetical protein [Streptomyces sp. NPDC047070]|uniref:hypothetical protein n=1 Tax=Streptomyces sp. NPDC047070 TaxID=3154923 RepID=UPI003451DC3B